MHFRSEVKVLGRNDERTDGLTDGLTDGQLKKLYATLRGGGGIKRVQELSAFAYRWNSSHKYV